MDYTAHIAGASKLFDFKERVLFTLVSLQWWCIFVQDLFKESNLTEKNAQFSIYLGMRFWFQGIQNLLEKYAQFSVYFGMRF